MAQQKLYEAEAEVETRNLPRCDPGLPRDTQNCMGTAGNVLNDHLPKKAVLYNLQQFQEFGRILSGIEA